MQRLRECFERLEPILAFSLVIASVICAGVIAYNVCMEEGFLMDDVVPIDVGDLLKFIKKNELPEDTVIMVADDADNTGRLFTEMKVNRGAGKAEGKVPPILELI